MNGAANFAYGHVGAAFRLKCARVAVALFREGEERVGLRQAVARLKRSCDGTSSALCRRGRHRRWLPHRRRRSFRDVTSRHRGLSPNWTFKHSRGKNSVHVTRHGHAIPLREAKPEESVGQPVRALAPMTKCRTSLEVTRANRFG